MLGIIVVFALVALKTYHDTAILVPIVTPTTIPSPSPTPQVSYSQIQLQKELPKIVINQQSTTLSMYRFSVNYPSTWVDTCDADMKCQERTHNIIGASINAPDIKTSIGITPFFYNQTTPFEEVVLNQIPDTLKENFKKTFQYTSRKANGLTFYETSYMPSGMSGCTDVFITDNQQRYVDFSFLCGYSTPENKKVYKEIYNQILSTFKFTN